MEKTIGSVDKKIPGDGDLVTTAALTTVKMKYLPLMIYMKNKRQLIDILP